MDGIVYALFYHRILTPPASLRDGPVVLPTQPSPQVSPSKSAKTVPVGKVGSSVLPGTWEWLPPPTRKFR